VDGVRLFSRLMTRAAVVLVTIVRGVVNGVRTAAAEGAPMHETAGTPHSPRGRTQ
jgi:hypothetical protein